MPETTEETGPLEDQDELVGSLPQFDAADETEAPDPPPPPAERTPSTTSPPPRRPQPASKTTESPSGSASGTSEPSITLEDLTDAIGDAAGQLFKSGAEWLNRKERRRRQVMTERWLATDDEVAALGELAERYLLKQVPDSVKESEDGLALASGGLILAGYAIRNLMGGGDGRAAPRTPAPAQPAAPAPAQPAAPRHAAPPAPPAAVLAQDDPARTGIVAPEAAPLAVISPGM